MVAHSSCLEFILMSPEEKLIHQISLMFGAAFKVLKDVEPDKTREMLDAAISECQKTGCGDDFPRSVKTVLFGGNNPG